MRSVIGHTLCCLQYIDIVQDSQPLARRGWAAQESLLSFRVLSFNEDRMTWRCHQIHVAEEGDEGGPEHHSAKRIESIADSLKPLLPGSGFEKTHWARFIESYSARRMTYEADTLPAISGIAQRIGQITGDAYCAGLWMRHFLYGLLWSPEMLLGLREGVEGLPQALRRRHEWIAPSWSWASIKGGIRYPSLGDSELEYCACLEECSVIHHGIDPFGALKEGFARVKGPVTLVTDIQAEEEFAHSFGSGCMFQLSNGTLTEGTVLFDFVHRTSCDVMMITPSWGICIEKVPHTTNTYVRIGVVRIRKIPLAERGRRVPITSDHVPPRSVILV